MVLLGLQIENHSELVFSQIGVLGRLVYLGSIFIVFFCRDIGLARCYYHIDWSAFPDKGAYGLSELARSGLESESWSV